MTYAEYINILRKKTMDKAVVEEIKKRKKEEEDKRTKIVAELEIVVDKIAIKIVENCVGAQFTIAWTPTDINKVDDRFH
jgi:hypothetical protein